MLSLGNLVAALHERRGMSIRWRIGLGILTTVMAAAGASDALATRRASDLALARLSAPPRSIAAGRSFSVTATVRNGGSRQAGSIRLSARLMRTGARAVKLQGTAEVKALKPGRRVAVRLRLKVPGAATAGRYRLVVCAARVPTKRGASANCRTAARVLKVTRQPRGSNGTPLGGGTPSPPAPGGTTANPLSVGAETLDTAHAVTQRLYGAGTLIATAADGTRYTLTVPSGALTGPEDITMTPVQHVAGLPFAGGLIGAVHLEPSGLSFLKPAMLTIQPPVGAPPATPTGFDYQQGGGDFHLYPVVPGSGAITLGVTHFSTPGVAAASSAEVAAVLAHTPAASEAQLEQSLAALPTLATVTGYYDNTVKPALEAAGTDDAKAPDAIYTALQWARQAEVLGIGGDGFTSRETEMWQLIEIAMRNAVNQGWQRCVNHDLTQIITLMQIQREAQLLGLDIGDASGKALACAHFQVDFDAEYTTEDHTYAQNYAPLDMTGDWKMQAQAVPLDIGGTATAPLTWVKHSYDQKIVYECAAGTSTLTIETQLVSADDSTARFELQLDINPREPAVPGQPAPPAPMEYLMITPQGAYPEHYTDTTSGCSSSSSSYTGWLWLGSLQGFHPQLRIPLDPSTASGAILDLQTISASKGGRASRDAGGAPLQTELMHIDVLHTPQSAP